MREQVREDLKALPNLAFTCCSGQRSTLRYRGGEGEPVMCQKHFLEAYAIRCSAAGCKTAAEVFCAEDGTEYCWSHGIQHRRAMAAKGIECGP